MAQTRLRPLQVGGNSGGDISHRPRQTGHWRRESRSRRSRGPYRTHRRRSAPMPGDWPPAPLWLAAAPPLLPPAPWRPVALRLQPLLAPPPPRAALVRDRLSGFSLHRCAPPSPEVIGGGVGNQLPLSCSLLYAPIGFWFEALACRPRDHAQRISTIVAGESEDQADRSQRTNIDSHPIASGTGLHCRGSGYAIRISSPFEPA